MAPRPPFPLPFPVRLGPGGFTAYSMSGNVTLTDESESLQAVTAAGSYAFTLPSSTTWHAGLMFARWNVGSNTFTIKNAAGDTLVTCAAGSLGIAVCSADGTWRAFVVDSGGDTLTATAPIVRTADAFSISAASGAAAGSMSAAHFTKLAALQLNATVHADPGNAGAIPVTSSGTCAITTAGAETRTLDIPAHAGQRITISMAVDGGDAVITASQAINQTGNTIITLNDAGDTVDLVGVTIGGALRWRVVANDGATLSGP